MSEAGRFRMEDFRRDIRIEKGDAVPEITGRGGHPISLQDTVTVVLSSYSPRKATENCKILMLLNSNRAHVMHKKWKAARIIPGVYLKKEGITEEENKDMEKKPRGRKDKDRLKATKYG